MIVALLLAGIIIGRCWHLVELRPSGTGVIPYGYSSVDRFGPSGSILVMRQRKG